MTAFATINDLNTVWRPLKAGEEERATLGYSWSGTYLGPGGGLFIKKSELSRLGLRRQRLRTIELYGENQGN